MLVINNVNVNGKTVNILIEGDRVVSVGKRTRASKGDTVIDGSGLTALPGFIDMHVHLREPGFEYKEDINSGTAAAVRGGFTAVACMPNTRPVTDSPYLVKYILMRAKEADNCRVYPIAAITQGEKGEQLSEMKKLKDAGAVAFSDDGVPVSDSRMMRNALLYAANFNLTVIEHCEDKSLAEGGVVNEGKNSNLLGLPGISRASEDAEIARNIVLSEVYGVPVHLAHVSTRGGMQLIREAKARGVKVTCETCPHYMALTDDEILGFNTMAKVNPPLREEEDRRAVIAAIADGTADCIVTDHAPHSKEDKDGGMYDSPNGISGLETSYAVSYTTLVEGGYISQEKLSQLMTYNPAKILGVECGRIEKGGLADITLVDNNAEFTVDPSKFASKGKNTPFAGKKYKGVIEYTIVGGKVKYARKEEI